MDMTVQEYLDFVSDIKKVDKKEKKRSMDKIMETVGIAHVRNRLIKIFQKVTSKELDLPRL